MLFRPVSRPPGAGEVASIGQSYVPAAFTEFLHSLDDLRLADGAAAEFDPWDPVAGTMDADEAFHACVAAGRTVCALPPAGPDQRALIGTAERVLTMLCATHPGDLALAAAGMLTDASLSGPAVGWPIARIAAASSGRARCTLDDLRGAGAARSELDRIVSDVTDWRAGRLAWRKVTASVLLYGPPGCGKTMAAEATTGSAASPSLARDMISRYMGLIIVAMGIQFALTGFRGFMAG